VPLELKAGAVAVLTTAAWLVGAAVGLLALLEQPGETANLGSRNGKLESYDKHNETGPEGPVPDGELRTRRKCSPPRQRRAA
jgi:hypothetical protein